MKKKTPELFHIQNKFPVTDPIDLKNVWLKCFNKKSLYPLKLFLNLLLTKFNIYPLGYTSLLG